jgi:hypothetical protein
MQIAILIVAMMLGTMAYFRLRTTRSAMRHGRKWDRRAGLAASHPFHAVSIMPDQQGCAAVESIKLRRFLSDEAPGLPLWDCGASDCGCKYVHHADRRAGARDRRAQLIDAPELAEFWSDRNRRNLIGRRLADRVVA